MERTVVIVKPDAVQSGLIGVILKMIEKKFKLVAIKMKKPTRGIMEKHFGKDDINFLYGETLRHMIGNPVVVMVWEGKNVIDKVISMIDSTPIGSEYQKNYNLVSVSYDEDDATRHLEAWFTKREMVSWRRTKICYYD